jgi:predicted outer membrane repeat protein
MEVTVFRPSFLVVLMMFALALPAAAILRVNAGGEGPFPTIQAAVDAAQEGDTISLADGTYRGVGNRDIDLLGKEITLCSAGGVPENCVLDCESLGRGFYLHQGEYKNTQILGLTIMHGKAETGGAIYCGEHVKPLIADCRFVDNSAEKNGGAIHSAFSGVRFLRCLMAGNRAEEQGGAVYVCCCSGVEFVNCTLANNHAPRGSAVSAVGFSDARIARSIIALNEGGEAVFFRAGHSSITPVFTNVFGNPGGDWVGDVAKDREQNDNMSADPLFVRPDSGNYALSPASPCRLNIEGKQQALGAIQ